MGIFIGILMSGSWLFQRFFSYIVLDSDILAIILEAPT